MRLCDYMGREYEFVCGGNWRSVKSCGQEKKLYRKWEISGMAVERAGKMAGRLGRSEPVWHEPGSG